MEKDTTILYLFTHGITRNGLRLHPDQVHVIYPMGNKVAIKNLNSSSHDSLTGHTNVISALCVSPCGKYIASGQLNHLGFKALVIIWDYDQRRIKGSHEIHKVRVEDVCFTCKSNYLISLGGRDDGNVVIWDVINNDAICGSFASNDTTGNALTITRMNVSDQCFITGGDRTLKIWRINPEARKICGINVNVGKLRRSINCVVVDTKDEDAYCGTSSGDIIKARLNFHSNWEIMEPIQTPVMIGCFSKVSGNGKTHNVSDGGLYIGGVQCLLFMDDDRLMVGAGDGSIELVRIINAKSFGDMGKNKLKPPTTPRIVTILKTNVQSAVTSMMMINGKFALVGTVHCEIYQIMISNFNTCLIVTCHTNAIYDIAFPYNYSEVFATASKNDIKVWRLDKQTEVLRITIRNFVCSSLCFSYDGKMIVSAWNDGLIRSFTPQSGKIIFAIHNSHIKATSAIAITTDGTKIVSGGCDGQVRIWEVKPATQKLVCLLKEHRGPVTCVHISSNNEDIISASSDGTCIIWNMTRGVRKRVLMANTMFMAARFSPNGVQVLTCGTDRKVGYWETLDGALVREVEGSTVGAINCLDISPDGQHFVTGSTDCIVKLWNYHTGEPSHIGVGHAAIITATKFTPDGTHIVSGSADGAIMIWHCSIEPKCQNNFPDKYSESSSPKSSCTHTEKLFGKLTLNGTDYSNENVMAITARSSDAESIKSTHTASADATPCERDHTKPTPEICQCRDDRQKLPISIQSSVSNAKAIRSDHSLMSRSEKSRQAIVSMKKMQGDQTKDIIKQQLGSVHKKYPVRSIRTKPASNSNELIICPTINGAHPVDLPFSRLDSGTKNYQRSDVPSRVEKCIKKSNVLVNTNPSK